MGAEKPLYRRHPLTEPTVAPEEYLRNVALEMDGDLSRLDVALLTRMLMEMEVSQQIGAERYQRIEGRRAYWNGYRERPWETRVEEIPLRIPKLRPGNCFPSFLEPRRRAGGALLAVTQTT